MSAIGAKDPLVGRTIAGGRYEVQVLLGAGSMGRVYRGRHVTLGRQVAIKVLHGSFQQDPRLVTRFNREAQAATRIAHENVVEILDYGQDPDGLLYIVMEFLEGKNIHSVIREEGPPPIERTVDIMSQVAAAIAAAHESGVIHRDLKPDNIVVIDHLDDDGHPRPKVKVLDFGIAKLTNPEGMGGPVPSMTIEMVTGTPEFMSPEQCKGEKLDNRSDLYSLGCILYYLATGVVPFSAENAVGVVLKQVTRPPVPPSRINPQVTRELEQVILKALEKDPARRYQDARSLRQELRALVGLTPRGAGPSTPSPAPPAPPASMRTVDIDVEVGPPVPPIQLPPGIASRKPSLESDEITPRAGVPVRAIAEAIVPPRAVPPQTTPAPVSNPPFPNAAEDTERLFTPTYDASVLRREPLAPPSRSQRRRRVIATGATVVALAVLVAVVLGLVSSGERPSPPAARRPATHGESVPVKREVIAPIPPSPSDPGTTGAAGALAPRDVSPIRFTPTRDEPIRRSPPPPVRTKVRRVTRTGSDPAQVRERPHRTSGGGSGSGGGSDGLDDIRDTR